MWRIFKRIRCQCTFCGRQWYIPRRRILRFEKFFDIKKGHRFVWNCHDCHQGVVVPETYINSHGEEVKIDPKNLQPNVKIVRF